MNLSRWTKPASRTASRPTQLSSTLQAEALEAREVPAFLVTGAVVGSGGVVQVYDAATRQLTAGFAPYGAGFTGGVNVAVGDINGDGTADIITATATGAAHVKVFSGTDFQEIRSFIAYTGFTGGVNVAVGDVNGDGTADIV
ncbi:MAG: VCBS repeat-containing protein, partial [Gemmataceae bacterium]|nr:VCBS repeat-containing protein [Gemmataceae bacterium]